MGRRDHASPLCATGWPDRPSSFTDAEQKVSHTTSLLFRLYPSVPVQLYEVPVLAGAYTCFALACWLLQRNRY